jgi:hypothetical protein
MMITTDTLHEHVPPEPSRALADWPDAVTVRHGWALWSFAVRPGWHALTLVGEALTFGFAIALQRRFAVVRAPGGRRVALSADSRLTPQAPGLYSVEIAIANDFRRVIHVAAFPPACLPLLQVREQDAQRRRLLAIMRDPRVTPESIALALESGDPTWGLAGAIVGTRPLAPGSGATPDDTFSIGDYTS